jgi:DNA invertase Pin-like site-specific DNA recombinase
MNVKSSSARLVGYARVSNNGQELQLQTDALVKAGVPKKMIFVDKVRGSKAAWPGLDDCLAALKEGYADRLALRQVGPLGAAPH